MGSNSGSNSGGNTGPANRYKTPAKKAADKVVDFVKGGGFVGAAVRGIKKGAAESKAKKEANVEMGLGTDRMSNYSTGQGGTRSDGGNSNVGAATSNGMVVQAPKVISPTTAEVSQVTSEEARASANELILKKRKGRGRSSTILTSAQGVQDNKGLTLGKPSLLG